MSFSLHAKKLIFTSAAFFLLASCAPDKIGLLAGLTTEPSQAPDDALLRSPEIDYATKGVDTTTFQGGTPNMKNKAVLYQSQNACIAYSVTGAMNALLSSQSSGPIDPASALSIYPIDSTKGGSKEDLKNFADKVAGTLAQNKITVSPLHSDKFRDAVKSALNSGNLVVFAFNYNDPKLEGDPLPIRQSGSDTISTTKNSGLYVCKYGNNNDICGISGINTGHAVIITGYDDNQQLFKIRNSFGSSAGDGGDFYMSYKFFSIRGIVWIELHTTGTSGSTTKKEKIKLASVPDKVTENPLSKAPGVLTKSATKPAR